jgi:hypothetical protein
MTAFGHSRCIGLQMGLESQVAAMLYTSVGEEQQRDLVAGSHNLKGQICAIHQFPGGGGVSDVPLPRDTVTSKFLYSGARGISPENGSAGS